MADVIRALHYEHPVRLGAQPFMARMEAHRAATHGGALRLVGRVGGELVHAYELESPRLLPVPCRDDIWVLAAVWPAGHSRVTALPLVAQWLALVVRLWPRRRHAAGNPF